MVLSAFKAPEKKTVVQVDPPERQVCDKCGFKSYVVATKGKSVLLFCLHHGQEQAEVLESKGWEIEDNTHLLKMNKAKDDDSDDIEGPQDLVAV